MTYQMCGVKVVVKATITSPASDSTDALTQSCDVVTHVTH